MPKLPRSLVHRQVTVQRSMLPNSAGGRTSLVSPEPRPLTAVPHNRPNEVIPITNPGAMTPGRSTPWDVSSGGTALVTIIRARTVSPSGNSTFRWRLNGTLVGNTITLPTGDSYVDDYQALTTVAGDELDLECLTVGSGLAELGGRAEING